MTKTERAVILQASQRISDLASLETARFDFDIKKDEEIKKEITPYMAWFQSVSVMLNDLCEADEKGDKYGKQDALEKIFRYCR